jgi:hypothetical protein
MHHALCMWLYYYNGKNYTTPPLNIMWLVFIDSLVGFASTACLTMNLFVIILDCRMCYQKIQSLNDDGERQENSDDKNLLPPNYYQICREYVQHRSDRFERKNASIVLVATLNIIMTIVTLFLSPLLRPGLPKNDYLSLFGFWYLYFKEIFLSYLLFLKHLELMKRLMSMQGN